MSEFARVILDKCNSAMGRLRVLLGFYFKANLSAKPLLRISVSFVLKQELITYAPRLSLKKSLRATQKCSILGFHSRDETAMLV